jgi:hypothetical protein
VRRVREHLVDRTDEASIRSFDNAKNPARKKRLSGNVDNDDDE